MGWTGIFVGGYLGSRLLGPLGALLGAAIGHTIEKMAQKASGGEAGKGRGASAGGRRADEMAFCASAAAMLAKMAKADGVVTQSEIDAVEGVFRRLGFSAAAREYAIKVFRRAKDDSHTIYEYAADFRSAVGDVEMRELFYGLLWELAAADGNVSDEEERILKLIIADLHVSVHFYLMYARQYAAYRNTSSRSQSSSGSAFGGGDTLADAYETLGVSPDASDDEVKKAYREKAKQLHPDRLRAQGLPEGMIGKANERMASVNDAWSKIKSARGIK